MPELNPTIMSAHTGEDFTVWINISQHGLMRTPRLNMSSSDESCVFSGYFSNTKFLFFERQTGRRGRHKLLKLELASTVLRSNYLGFLKCCPKCGKGAFTLLCCIQSVTFKVKILLIRFQNRTF